MLPSRVTLQLMAFLFLSGAVAANIFLLQSNGRFAVRMPSAEDAWNIAALEAAEIVDTGSIGTAAASRMPGVIGAPPLEDMAGASDAPSYRDTTRAVQRELQIRGYETGGRDGVAGVMTRGAILAYEHDHGLALTARPSQQLLKAIILGEDGKSGGKRAEASAEAREVIRSVQTSLAKLGYKPGPATGVLSKDTVRAIRAFEGHQALPETGRISGPLIARLARLSGEGRVAAAP